MKILPLINEHSTTELVVELSSSVMQSYRKKAIGDAMCKHHAGGAVNEIQACKRAKNIARSVRLEMKRKRQIKEAVSNMPMDAAKSRLASLKADLAEMPRTLHSQEQYDAVDDIRDEIKELEAYISGGVVKESASAADAYGTRIAQVRELLSKIDRSLVSHTERQSGNADSWGFAGDLAHVAEQLEDILEFLTSGESKDTVVEGFGSESELPPNVVSSITRGETELYDLMQENTPIGRTISRMFDVTAGQHHLHPDDDMQQILDIMYDEISQKYGNDDGNNF